MNKFYRKMKKIVFLGEPNSGKSSILSYYIKNRKYPENHYPTLGVEAGVKTILYENQQYALIQFWDTAGKAAFHDEICRKYYENTDAFLIVVDKSDRRGLKSIRSWLDRIKEEMGMNKKYIVGVLANKKDLENEEEPSFTFKEFEEMYGREGIEMFQEVSLKDNSEDSEKETSVEAALRKFVRILYRNNLLLVEPEFQMDKEEKDADEANNCNCRVM